MEERWPGRRGRQILPELEIPFLYTFVPVIYQPLIHGLPLCLHSHVGILNHASGLYNQLPPYHSGILQC